MITRVKKKTPFVKLNALIYILGNLSSGPHGLRSY
jgi:hypothetical protein